MFESSLYISKVSHYRKEPVERRFSYNIFMWYLNLDEIPALVKKIFLMSHNKFNYYSFNDSDHLKLDHLNSQNISDHIKQYAKNNGENEPIDKIMLLTNLTTLGYQFNPVSFYFCFNKKGEPLCAIAEVGNTYREMKPFFMGKEHFKDGVFRFKTKKLFYVSPFIDHDVDFDFYLPLPNYDLNIRIDDYKGDNKFFTAILKGKRKILSNKNVILSALQFPLITIKVIALIHYQAFLLWLKKIGYHKKSDHSELQVGVYNNYNLKN